MKLKRIATIAKTEYLENVKRKEFILMTILFPVFMIGILFVTVFLSASLMEEKTIGIVDNSGIFADIDKRMINADAGRNAINDTADFIEDDMRNEPVDREFIKFKKYGGVEKAREDLLDEKINAYVVVPEDYIYSKNATLYALRSGLSSYAVEDILNDAAMDTLLERENFDDRIINFIKTSTNLKTIILTEEGEEKGEEEGFLSFFSLFLFPFLFVMVIFISSTFLLQGIVEEKENRVIEILLSSVTGEELFAGKILGLGTLGLTQILVWSVFALPAVTFITFVLPFSASAILLALVYFILGYILYASIFAGIGAISTSLKEANQISGIFSMIAISPVFFIWVLLENPNALVFKIISYIPLLTPVVMMFRLPSLEFYEIILSIGVLIISTFVVIKLSAKIFKKGVLMEKRPDIKEILNLMR